MSTINENHRDHVLYVSANIRDFRTAGSLRDYLATKSRIHDRSMMRTRGPRSRMVQWLHSWSRADKLGIIIAVTGIVVAVVTIAAFIAR
jgi:hypothetical protein